MGPVLGPHARNDRTRDTRAAEPRLPAPEDRRPGEGQRLTPDAPRNDGVHPPPGTPFRHPYNEQRTTAPTHQPRDIRTPSPALRHSDTTMAERWTRHTRSSGHWDSETATETPHKGTRARTPTWRQYRSPPREARPRSLRRRRAVCPPCALRGNGATAPAEAGAPNSTLSPAPMTERCPR